MNKTEKAASQLRGLMHERRFVRFTRRFEDGFVRGYVLDVGPKFFMMATMGEQMRFDGFSCFRIADVKGLKVDPYAAFAETAIRRLKERRPRNPRISVASIEELLRGASSKFPLVTVHRETVKPDVCWIGRIQQVEDGKVWLLEIGPDAKWDATATGYKLNEITQIGFGGAYENALHLVGGEPPKVD